MVFSKDYYFFYFAITLFMVFHRGMTIFKCDTYNNRDIGKTFESEFIKELDIVKPEDERNKSDRSTFNFDENAQYIIIYVAITKGKYGIFQKSLIAENMCLISAHVCLTLPPNAKYVGVFPGPQTEIDYQLKNIKKPLLMDRILNILPVIQCKMDITAENYKRDTDGKLTGKNYHQ